MVFFVAEDNWYHEVKYLVNDVFILNANYYFTDSDCQIVTSDMSSHGIPHSFSVATFAVNNKTISN